MKIFVLQVIFLIIFNICFGRSHAFVPRNVVDSYFNAEEICLRQYYSRIDSITQEVKADSISCLRAAGIRFQSNEKFEILQEPMKKCSSPKSGIKDYFKCIENIVPEIQIKLREITSVSQIFLQNNEKIEENKTACLNKASSKANDESSNAAFNLNMCLQSIHQLQINSKKEQMVVENPSLSEDMDEFLSHLNVIKEKYNQLKSCTLDYNNYYKDCWNNASKLFEEQRNYFKDRFAGNSSEYFSKITEIDEADDSCLRQYILKNIVSTYTFDLQSCLLYGFRTTVESEENSEKDKKLIEDLKEVYKQFTKCRVITKDLEIHHCVQSELKSTWDFRKIQEGISMRSETNFKNFKETVLSSYTDQYHCIENLCDFGQFYGFNLRSIEKNVLLSCYEKGYKPTTSLPFDEQLIKDLSEIQNFLKTCTKHPKSPGYNHCFRNIINVYHSTKEYLQENSNYTEIIANHDKTHGTCFEDIVTGITSNSLMQSKKCLFP